MAEVKKSLAREPKPKKKKPSSRPPAEPFSIIFDGNQKTRQSTVVSGKGADKRIEQFSVTTTTKGRFEVHARSTGSHAADAFVVDGADTLGISAMVTTRPIPRKPRNSGSNLGQAKPVNKP